MSSGESDSDGDDGAPPITLLDLKEAGVRVRNVTVERPGGSGVLLRSLGLSISSTESSQISGAIITAVDNMSPASLTGQIYVDDVIVAINNKYLLGTSFGMVMMAIAESGHSKGSKITFTLASSTDLKARGLFSAGVHSALSESSDESEASDSEAYVHEGSSSDSKENDADDKSEASGSKSYVPEGSSCDNKENDTNTPDNNMRRIHTSSAADISTLAAHDDILESQTDMLSVDVAEGDNAAAEIDSEEVVEDLLPPHANNSVEESVADAQSDQDSRSQIESLQEISNSVPSEHEDESDSFDVAPDEATTSITAQFSDKEQPKKKKKRKKKDKVKQPLNLTREEALELATGSSKWKVKKSLNTLESPEKATHSDDAQTSTEDTDAAEISLSGSPAPTRLGSTKQDMAAPTPLTTATIWKPKQNTSVSAGDLAKAIATSDEVRKLAEQTQEAANKAKANKDAAAEWRSMQAALQKKLEQESDLDDDSESADESPQEQSTQQISPVSVNSPSKVVFGSEMHTEKPPVLETQGEAELTTQKQLAVERSPTSQEKISDNKNATPSPSSEAEGQWLSQVPLRFVELQRGSSGLGFQIQKGSHQTVRIVEVKPSSVADLAGLRVGDVMVRVGTVSALGKSVQEIGLMVLGMGSRLTMSLATSAEFDKFAPAELSDSESEPEEENGTIITPTRAGQAAAEKTKATLPEYKPDPASAAAVEALPEQELYDACCDELETRNVRIIKCSQDKGLGLRLFSAAPTWACPNPRGIRIAKIFPGSPAERTRALNVGDVVLEVNSVVTIDATHQDVVTLIKGAQIAPPPGQFFAGQEAKVSDFVATPGADGLERRFTNVPVKYVRRSPGELPLHIVELDSGVQLEVPGRCLIVAAEQLQVSVVSLKVTAQLGFDALVRRLEREREVAVVRPQVSQEFSESEERRTIMAVLKQNLIMGAITQDEYDHMAEVNSATLGVKKEDVPLADRLLNKGKAWLKKKLDIDLKPQSKLKPPTQAVQVPLPDEPAPPPPIPPPTADEPIIPITGRFAPLDDAESQQVSSIQTPSPSPSPRKHKSGGKKKKPRRRKILEDENQLDGVPDPLKGLMDDEGGGWPIPIPSSPTQEDEKKTAM